MRISLHLIAGVGGVQYWAPLHWQEAGSQLQGTCVAGTESLPTGVTHLGWRVSQLTGFLVPAVGGAPRSKSPSAAGLMKCSQDRKPCQLQELSVLVSHVVQLELTTLCGSRVSYNPEPCRSQYPWCSWVGGFKLGMKHLSSWEPSHLKGLPDARGDPTTCAN